METIMLLDKNSYAYKQLEKACEILTATSKRGATYKVEDTYFDYGQGWEWTTIIAYDPNSFTGSWQALNPAQHEAIIESDDLYATISNIKLDTFWPDK